MVTHVVGRVVVACACRRVVGRGVVAGVVVACARVRVRVRRVVVTGAAGARRRGTGEACEQYPSYCVESDASLQSETLKHGE